MSQIKLRQSIRPATRRAIVSSVFASQHDRRPNPLGTRGGSAFPLSLAIGLMTIGVIAVTSLLQLLTAWFG